MVDGIEAAGDILSGAVMARAVSPRSGGDGHGAAHGDCLNCGEPLTGPFCSNCGQMAHLHRTLGAIGHEIAHGVFHFEGRTWHTLPLLAWRPGDLTRRYVHGQRARFVSPLALFLFSVFLMFAVFHSFNPLAGGPGKKDTQKLAASGEDIAKKLPEVDARVAALRAQRNAALAQGQDVTPIDRALEAASSQQRALQIASIATGVAADADKGQGVAIDPDKGLTLGGGRGFTVDTGWTWFDRTMSHASRNPELALYKVQSNAYKYSWLLIPISLPFIWMMFFWWRGVTLYDHAIFAIHSLSFMTLFTVVASLVAAAGLGGGWLVLVVLIVPPVHMYRHLKGAYRLGRMGTLWRTAWLMLSATVALSIFVAAMVTMGLGD